MGLLITVLLIFIATIVIFVIKDRNTLDLDERLMFGFLFGTIIALFSLIPLVVISTAPNAKEVLSETIEITALKDNNNTEGSFFLGSGTIDEEQYYYYIKESSRGKTIEKIPTENAYINEGNYDPHIKVYKYEYTGAFAKWYFGEEAWGETVYEIYIPEGSVTTEFNVDLE